MTADPVPDDPQPDIEPTTDLQPVPAIEPSSHVEPPPGDLEPAPGDVEPLFLAVYLASTQAVLERLGGALGDLRRGSPAAEAEALDVLHRGFHSLHGNSSFLPRCPITPLAGAAEQALKAARDRGLSGSPELLALLVAVLERCAARLDEYRRGGSPSRVEEREAEGEAGLAAALLALAEAGTRSPTGEGGQTRYLYAGQDVTAVLELLARHDTPASPRHAGPLAERGLTEDRLTEDRLKRAREELRRHARAIEDRELLELLDRRDGDSRTLLRLLVQRVERRP